MDEANKDMQKKSSWLTWELQIKTQSHLPMNSVTNDEECGIYQLQTITIKNQNFTIFYDSGCGDFVSKWSAIQKLGTRPHQEHSGPVKFGGVGGLSTESPFGICSVNLPLHNGRNALLFGVCLAKITDDIQNAYLESGGNIEDLPKLPEMVGGKIDFIIGTKYLRYHPQTIYESAFKNPDGSRGVVGGAHKVFLEIERYFHLTTQNASNFLSNQLQLFQIGYHAD